MGCESEWEFFKGKCYYVYQYQIYTYEESKTICECKGGSLVKIENADENLYLYGFSRDNAPLWIGANDRDSEGNWQWEDGSQVINLALHVLITDTKCQQGWESFNGHCYLVSEEPTHSYQEAQAVCENSCSNLVIVNNADEQLFIEGFSLNKYNIWIGLNDIAKEGEWKWEDNSLLSEVSTKTKVQSPSLVFSDSLTKWTI
ncbi:C-type mannose receptor 2-like [Glandiceps talaboti]